MVCVVGDEPCTSGVLLRSILHRSSLSCMRQGRHSGGGPFRVAEGIATGPWKCERGRQPPQ